MPRLLPIINLIGFRWIGILLFLCWSSAGFALQLNQESSRVNVYSDISYYLDESKQLQLEQIGQQSFQKAPVSRDSNLAFGYTTASVWIRFDLVNQTPVQEWLLEVGYPILDQVELFVLQDQELVSHFKTGDRQPVEQRPINHRNFIFPLQIKSHQKMTVYLRVESSSSLRVPLTIWQQKIFFEADQYRLLAQGSYFGVLLIMMLYNLFIYFSIREKAYLHYVFYVAAYIVVQASINGFWGQFLWFEPNSLTDKSIVLSLSLVILFGCSFSVSFLNLKFNHLNAYRIISGIGWLGGVCFVLAFLASYAISIKVTLVLAVIGALVITVVGLILWHHHGVREARFFSIAWVGFLLGSVLMMLSRMSFLPDNFITENAAQLGSAFEVSLLSFALADKFSQMRGESKKVESNAKRSLKKINALLTETLIRLEKSNAIKNDFLATVSHELRTPMNGIVASNDLLKTLELPPEASEFVQISDQSAKQMMTLIDSMLQFVEVQSGNAKVQKKIIDIDCLFKEIEDKVRSKLAQKKVVFIIDVPEFGNIELYSDYQKIITILEELLDNAFKFTSIGEVHLGARLLGEGALDDIEFYVKDTGIGIDTADQGKIFDAFYLVDASSNRRYGGLGMGLTTAQSLANLLGGVISVESAFGEGSQFKFRLPLYSLKT